jgi:hypothetical protein
MKRIDWPCALVWFALPAAFWIGIALWLVLR